MSTTQQNINSKGHTMEKLQTQTQTQNKGFHMENTTIDTLSVAVKSPLVTYTASDVKLFPWAGSKAKYIKHFANTHAEMKAKKVKYYIEAFAGTLASMFHNLNYVEAEVVVINDLNTKLMNLYTQIKNNPEELFEKFLALENEYIRIIPENLLGRAIKGELKEEFKANEAFFLEARTVINTIQEDINHAAIFLFLLNRNYRGLYKENKKGEFKPSFNWSANKLNVEKIKKSIDNLHTFFNTREVIFESMDVFDLIEKYDYEDTFIYLDSPYYDSKLQYIEGSKSFVYLETHLELIELCNKYKYVMYSNNHTEEFVPYFDAYVNFNRSNKITKNDKKPKIEILAFKVNVREAIKARSIEELLGIALNQQELMVRPINNPNVSIDTVAKSTGVTKLLNIEELPLKVA